MAGFIQTAKAFDSQGAAAIPAPELDWANGQKVSVSISAIQSSAIDSTLVLVKSDARCLIKAGSNPTASAAAGSLPIAIDESFYMTIQRNDKISIISDSTATGSIYIIPAKEGAQPPAA